MKGGGVISSARILEAMSARGYYFHRLPVNFDDFLRSVKNLGPIYPQYSGEEYNAIQVNTDTTNYDAQGLGALNPHTEAVEFPDLPPRWLALWCEHQGIGSTEHGVTQICSIEDCFTTLSTDKQNRLREKSTTYKSTRGLYERGLGMDPVSHPFLARREDGTSVFRFSVHCMEYAEDPDLSEFVSKFQDYFQAHHTRVEWTNGAFLVWDNHKYAHARSAIQDPARVLKRVWIR